MTRNLDKCCSMYWERKIMEAEEGRNVAGEKRSF